ncbi:MAG: metal-dependent hydrolase [Gemmatimonadetes bacterium]|nr:metal-dependent hydrolase [Gemmatimonadota bacterium]
MAFPPAHLLVGVGFAELVGAITPLSGWKPRLAAASLAVLPDLDIIVGLVGERAGSAYHGTFTHSIFATLVIGALAWLLAGPAWGMLAASGYGSHLLVDLLDDRGRTNVLLGWPFSQEYPYAIARIFPTVPFEQGHGLLPAALSLLEPDVFQQLAIQTMIGAAMLAFLLLVSRLVRGATRLHRTSAP